LIMGENPDEDRVRPLHENLARYLDPCAFDGRRRSKRNSDAAFRARKHATKQARAAIRFMLKPGNLDRLLATAARKESIDE
jgi:hypothetical protein